MDRGDEWSLIRNPSARNENRSQYTHVRPKTFGESWRERKFVMSFDYDSKYVRFVAIIHSASVTSTRPINTTIVSNTKKNFLSIAFSDRGKLRCRRRTLRSGLPFVSDLAPHHGDIGHPDLADGLVQRHLCPECYVFKLRFQTNLISPD